MNKLLFSLPNLICNRIAVRGYLLILTVIFSGSLAKAQSLNNNWERDLNSALEKFQTCATTSADKNSCSTTVGQSLSMVYKIDGFYSDKLKRYLMPQEVSKAIQESGKWTLLGQAYDQKVLEVAQRDANLNKAVVAIYTTAGSSHVALILPGKLQFSGSWGFNVPNSASFFHNDPAKSYVNKGLSYGFAKSMIKDISLYVLNY